MADEKDGSEAYNVFDKAQTVDPEVRAHVYSLVTALGGSGIDESGNYVLGDDALACLRDLKRWLKLHDEKTNRLDVARCLAEANLVNGDILPILTIWTEETNADRLKTRLALACLELLVPLTWPLEVGDGMTVNHHRHTPYIRQAHIQYKARILDYERASILRTIVRVGIPSIATSKDDRTTRDEGIIKLMLYFFRNIAIIAPIPNLPTQGLDNEISRSATIEAFRQQDVFALLLTMCSNMGEDFSLQDVIILEIIFNLIKGLDVEDLFMNEEQRQVQKTTELKNVLDKEKGMHRDYAKIAPTRHGRFGTMIWVKREDEMVSAISGQDNLKDGRNSLLKMDKSKKWSKPQQRRRDLDHSIHDFDRSERLTTSATELMRNFVEEFLDSGFNPLFTHLRKAIEREADRLTGINYRQFFFTVSWFLQAERCRRAPQEKDRQHQRVQTEFEVESYGLVAGVLNQETFITLNRYMQTSVDNKEWQDLNASMKCFTQILLTVQEMAQSALEEDQEIADNIQNRIFYEEATHDRIVNILKGYKNQGFGYLEACTQLSHVFLRMLERYSKENADLQIRSRRRAKRKKKETLQKDQNMATEDEEDENARSENEEIAEAARVSRERKFDFTRFAAKFTSQSSVDTFVAFTAFYRDLSPEQLKRAHRFFYRVAFRQDLSVLLYRVDIVALFHRMIRGPEGLHPSHAMYKEWDELVRQVLKRMFKKLEQRPQLIVEMLFSKIRATLYYLEYGHDRQTVPSTRAPAILGVKPASGRDSNEQIGIVVAALVEDGKETFARWLLETITEAADERKAWEAEAAARREISIPPTEAQREAPDKELGKEEPNPPFIVVRATSQEIRTATFKNAKLKLLMTLSGFERLGPHDKPDAVLIIPSAIPSTQLQDLQATIEKYLRIPWTDVNGRRPEDLLYRVKTTSAYPEDGEPRRDGFIDDSEGSDDLAAFMFPDNVRSRSNALDQLKKQHKKRKLTRKDAEPTSEDALDERRKARERAALDRRRKIKSELYIRDSDEEMDEEENRVFFEREEENRKQQAARAFAAMSVGWREESVGKDEKSELDGQARKKRRRQSDSEDSEDEMADEGGMELMGIGSTPSPRHSAPSDDKLEIEDTPLSSQSQSSDTRPGKDAALADVQQSRLNYSAVSKGRDAENSDGELPVMAYQRRRVRAGFILDDSDEE